MTIDRNAPIMPGVGAAGLKVGTDVARTVYEASVYGDPEEIVNPYVPGPSSVRYRSALVDLWAKEGRITQIGVHGGYQGRILNRIGLGATVGDAERLIGRVVESDEGETLEFPDMPGVCFEVERDPLLPLDDPAHRIAWIFVYLDDAGASSRP